jgi:hypothetical protein
MAGFPGGVLAENVGCPQRISVSSETARRAMKGAPHGFMTLQAGRAVGYGTRMRSNSAATWENRESHAPLISPFLTLTLTLATLDIGSFSSAC